MTHLYTNDHSRITSYLRNYDPKKQNFCLLSYNDTSRPIIVPQEYLIHFDDFLLPCNVPTIIAKPLTAIKHLVSALLNDKEESYFTALSKQVDSSNELLFISAKVITFMVKAEKAISLQQYTTPEQYTPKQPTTTTGKPNKVLTSRTLRDLTYKIYPDNKNPSHSPLTTLTHILECYDHTLIILLSLDTDSQRITQSSKQYKQQMSTLFFALLIPCNTSQVNLIFFSFMVHFLPIQLTFFERSITFCNTLNYSQFLFIRLPESCVWTFTIL